MKTISCDGADNTAARQFALYQSKHSLTKIAKRKDNEDWRDVFILWLVFYF